MGCEGHLCKAGDVKEWAPRRGRFVFRTPPGHRPTEASEVGTRPLRLGPTPRLSLQPGRVICFIFFKTKLKITTQNI